MTQKYICSFWNAWTLHSSQHTRLCGPVRAAASSPTAPWTSTASSLFGTFGPKMPGCTCAPAPTCLPWTRAQLSSLSQVCDWRRSLSHRSLRFLTVSPPVHDSCMFSLLSCLVFFLLLILLMAYFSLVLFEQLLCKKKSLFFFGSSSVRLSARLTTNQTALAFFFCVKFLSKKNTACERLREKFNDQNVLEFSRMRLMSSIRVFFFYFLINSIIFKPIYTQALSRTQSQTELIMFWGRQSGH